MYLFDVISNRGSIWNGDKVKGESAITSMLELAMVKISSPEFYYAKSFEI